MFSFTDHEREYLIKMRDLTTDQQGQEILIGLTYEETVFYIEYGRKRISGSNDYSHLEKDRYLELHEKKEAARFSVLAAEHQLRTDKPTLQ